MISPELKPKVKQRKIAADQDIKAAFNDFVLTKDHPCIMAQTVFGQDHLDLHTYDEFPSRKTAQKIYKDLKKYIENYDFESNEFYTFLAVFKGQNSFSEMQFETALWKQLEFIHNIDNEAWDPNVSKNPEDNNFSFSIGGKAFYIVGLHPDSSRKARQSPYPAIAFNLHWQFEKLREMGVFTSVRDKIRERDIELQGNINPMLEDFGESSETRQYSGRKVGEEWKCPFLHGKK
ncbi:YqcI/YcgG family protein [Salegentibacter sp. JZCK2]|uniref:guanitoxin biosynthesis heme-dependent pre-guanitoxin N-hydroxylase GntA n=1 Tax=Salegentibacter tibetensis TaxID=2873600 RepID=UPI001CCD01B3|nr:guanitoxin biosynthesis heme-dependent pre-guanitoxin N-hydroxylase GntA [Salegentibacter tibetensis]MBZ9731478.1 YqcI/YcgG family protein [Salegentibacter tibetensis]